MSTPRKARKGHTRITADLLTKMNELYTLGLPAKKIAPFLNISESTAKKYICVLNAINNSTNFSLASDLCWNAIAEYCVIRKVPMPANTHGVPEPKEPEQQEMKIPEDKSLHYYDMRQLSLIVGEFANQLESAIQHIKMASQYLAQMADYYEHKED